MDNLDVVKPATVEPAQPPAAPAATEPAISQAPAQRRPSGPSGVPEPAGGPAQPKAVEKPSRKDAAAPKPPVYWGTGRRKEAIARVRLLEGLGTILVNGRPFDQYFPRESLRLAVRQPLLVTHQLGKHNVLARLEGGGLTGQAGALCLGIARALVRFDPGLRISLRAAGLLTRDPREKERKKYGQKGARKRFQWTKR